MVISVNQLVKKINKISGLTYTSIAYEKAIPTVKTSLCLDWSRAMELFEWKPKVSLDLGIKKKLLNGIKKIMSFNLYQYIFYKFSLYVFSL
jgi:nucleoside-diphosphate-sugar epimerase